MAFMTSTKYISGGFMLYMKLHRYIIFTIFCSILLCFSQEIQVLKMDDKLVELVQFFKHSDWITPKRKKKEDGVFILFLFL